MVTRLTAHAIPGVINHLLDNAPWLRRSAIQLADRPVQLTLAGIPCNCVFDSSGKLTMTDAPPQASITLDIILMIRLATGDIQAQRDVTLQGDSTLAIEFGQLLGQLSWDAEADLARIIGDVPARFLSQTIRRIAHWKRDTSFSKLTSFIEYHQEESLLLAKRSHLQRWSHSVDTLRDDSARLEKRIALLEQHACSTAID